MTPCRRIELPTGVRLEDTAAASAAAYRIVARQSEVTNVVESIGEGDSDEIRAAQLYISLVPRNKRSVTQKEWEDRVITELKTIPDAQIHFSKQSGGGSSRDINIFITVPSLSPYSVFTELIQQEFVIFMKFSCHVSVFYNP